jgi:N-methylhydantoinase A/oxoprolinase/acetone carboxylase beta subunit
LNRRKINGTAKHDGQHRVTVDTGGTFSDFVFFNEDTARSVYQGPFDPKEPFQAVLNGVKELVDGAARSERHPFLSRHDGWDQHVLEEKGAKTGLLVTQGFREFTVMEQTCGYGRHLRSFREATACPISH